jgi:hypothetical protein
VSDLRRLLSAARIPDHSFPLFGADPCHTPAREAHTPATCPKCNAVILRGGRPVGVHEVHISATGSAERRTAVVAAPLTLTCGWCQRSAHDGSKALSEAVKPCVADDNPTPRPKKPPGPLDPRTVAEHRGQAKEGLKGGLG